MQPSSSYRPRVSRESRLLLIAGAAAIGLLWVLARIRFEDQPVTPNPVAPVLSQLSQGASYDSLASEIVDLEGRLSSSLMLVDLTSQAPTAAPARRRVVALGWRDGLAIAVVPTEHRIPPFPTPEVRALDPATGLALIRLPDRTAAFAPTTWTPRRTQQARYFMSGAATPTGVSLRPTFVGSLAPIDGVVWPGTIWAAPSGAELEPGAFLFTTTGEFAGLAVASDSGFAIVPGATVMAEAERLLDMPLRPAGTIGVEVQALDDQLAGITGATAGVVVTWVRRDGPAWGTLVVGDVIEAADGRQLVSREQWESRVARLVAGETLSLRVRRRGEISDKSIEAAVLTTGAGGAALGLEMRRRPALGAEVTRVQPGGVAARAGLSSGDIITLVGNTASPSPNQVARTFAALRPGDRVMVAVTRGEAHFLTALGR